MTTNRGHKLAPSAKHVRRGRLGAFPNVDAGFAPLSANKRQRTLAGEADIKHGFAVAPNLHLIPRNLDIEDRPIPAHLPPAPQTPLDLLLSTGLQATLGPRNKTFLTLALSATGLIEQEAPLIGALSRVCAGLRGEGYEWRWKGDKERKDSRDKERKQEADHQKEKAELLEREQEASAAETAAREEEANKAHAEAEAAARTTNGAAAPELIVAGSPVAERVSDAQPDAMEVDSVPTAVQATTDPSVPPATAVNGLSAESTPAGEASPAPPTSDVSAPVPGGGAVPEASNGANQDGASSAPVGSTLPPLPPLPLPPVSTSTEALPNGVPPVTNGDTPAEPVLLAAAPEPAEAAGVEADVNGDGADGEGEGEQEAEPEEAPRRSGRRVASRLPDPTHLRESSESGSDSEETVQPRRQVRRGPAVADEELPEYARRLVDPEVYVRSLFVSEENVEMPTPAVPGMVAAGVDILSPNEQEVMVHDCLT